MTKDTKTTPTKETLVLMIDNREIKRSTSRAAINKALKKEKTGGRKVTIQNTITGKFEII